MRKITTFSLAILLTASAFGAGEVYRWRGADGSWHYSDQPRPGAELVVTGTRPRPEAVQPPPPAAAEPPAATTDEPLPVSAEVAQEVRTAAASAKAEQCKRAEEAYQQSLISRRIYKTDAEGKRVFLNAAEMDAARLQARASRDLACGSGS